LILFWKFLKRWNLNRSPRLKKEGIFSGKLSTDGLILKKCPSSAWPATGKKEVTKKNNQWKVYDMVIEGVSLIGNYRSQFARILEKDSFQTLVEKLEKKIAR